MGTEGLILAGGKSLRMGGRHKGGLLYQNRSFTEILIRELKKEVRCVRVSYGCEVKEDCGECQAVLDIYPDCGPIGGLHAGLCKCSSEFVLTAACDMPLLKIELFRFLMDKLCRDGRELQYDGAVPVTEGHIHPLAAVYKKDASAVFEEQIKKGNYCLRDVLRGLHILYVDMTGNKIFEPMLRNINTWEEYERLLGK